MEKNISIPALRRLPSYYNIVCLALDAGDKYISSATIAKQLDIDDTQVRKDIASIGYVGKPKVGFDVNDFKNHLENYLGFNKQRKAVLIGAGNLGIALARYDGFQKYGLNIDALFDNDPLKIGIKILDKEVFSISYLPEYLKQNDISIAILALPGAYAQEVADFIIEAGIKAIWSFAPTSLIVPNDVVIETQDLAASFITFAQLVDQKSNKD